ncbi:lipopolysaccharide transport periplasmic protein LptA [Tahibacter amnicola]|uniref:Lipopolysaccharide export system protein LptA n=1 Tax=Tahibacter amnicola TaxID=2976241 RepID=A0ABY6BFW3_9GAMM|nr:lipopolysaccharide transport periplasmic protein LptA [Tahibacter amnicola]UXI67496.1 lipopolysaccharide transport periplasmic protein LptA [Tahibacter amnicola]
MYMPRSRARASLSLVAVLALAAPAAFAKKSDQEQPLDVYANHFQADQGKQTTVLSGSVKLTQGTIQGEADKGTVHQDKNNQIQRVVLEGKPARLQQQLDDGGGMMRASAHTIDYAGESATAVLSGDAVVVQEGRGEFRGERIVYNTASGEVTGGSESGSGRVHLKMLPKPKDPAKAADAETKK